MAVTDPTENTAILRRRRQRRPPPILIAPLPPIPRSVWECNLDSRVKSPTNQPTGIDPILSYAWQVWKENLGLLAGVTFVAGLINFGISYFFDIAAGMLQQNNAAQEVVLIVSLLGSVVGQAVQTFLGIGETQIVLKMLRRQPAQFGDLFGGGPMFLPVLGFSILFGVGVAVGFLLLIVPGVILLLMCWPAYYLVLDRKAGIIDSFALAATITKDNWGTAFVLWLASLGIVLVGLLALCVGVIFAAPLVSVIWGTAYLMMSGQLLTHRPAPPSYLPPGYSPPSYPPPSYPHPMPGKH